jgi:O-antigen/teichoic acid export membrane protein
MQAVAADGAERAGLRRWAVRGAAVLLASRLAIQGLLWAVTLLVARLLRPDDYGLMTTGLVFTGLADLLAEAGVGKALIQKRQLDDADLAESFTASLLLAVALYGALFFLAGPASRFLDAPELVVFLRVLGLAVILTPLRATPQALLDRGLHMGRQSAVAAAFWRTRDSSWRWPGGRWWRTSWRCCAS